MSYEYSIVAPLSELIPTKFWPTELNAEDGSTIDDILSKILFSDYNILTIGEEGIGFELMLIITEEISLRIPGMLGAALVLGSRAGTEMTNIRASFFIGKNIFILHFDDIDIALRFPPNILKPALENDGTSPAYAEISLHGSLLIDENLDFKFSGFDRVSLSPCMIGSSDIIISAEDARLDLSRTNTLPEMIDAGFDESFVGVFIGNAKVKLPKGLSVLIPEELVLRNCAIGSGGVSGTLEAHYSPTYDSGTKTFSGNGAGELFGIPFGLKDLNLVIKQNAFVESKITGQVLLPYFEEVVDVEIGINIDGGLTAKLTGESGLYTFTKPGILSFKLVSIGFNFDSGSFSVVLSGSLKLLYGNLDWPEIDLEGLTIDKDGHIKIEGGWIELPKSASLDFNGFIMELTKIGLGSGDGRRWIGFSGGIRLVEQLAFGASLEGIKVMWDSSGNVDLQMSSIKVELEIPNVLYFKGFVEYFQDADAKGFKGDIALTLHSLKLSLDAKMMVGRKLQDPAFNFFYIFISADLPAGIPLAQTNLSIYGFSGLMGNNMAPSKGTDQEWFNWYLTEPSGTTEITKWIKLFESRAMGAGITLGTASDNGYAFSAKTLLILLLPGPILLIDGKANLLEDRSKLSGQSQGQHRALAVLDLRAGTFLMNLQPTYKYDPATGSVINVIGAAEAFFDFNRPEAWHLYLGQDEPQEKRIRAALFEGLLNADSYLMLDNKGMRLGASAGFDESYDFGRLSVDLKALIDGKADVSWRPLQVDGTLDFQSEASLRAFGFSSSVSVNALLAVQTPRPFYIHGEFRVRLKTPWPLPDPSARVGLDWGDPDGEPEAKPTLISADAEHLKVSEAWNLNANLSDAPIIPLDAKLLLAFARPTIDRALVGNNSSNGIKREKVGAYEVLYELSGIEIYKKGSHGWILVERRVEGEGDMYGTWLPLPSGNKASGKLQLWSKSPFTYMRNTKSSSYFDSFTEGHPNYPCPEKVTPELVCADFESTKLGVRSGLFVEGDLIFEFLFPKGEETMRPKVVAYQSTTLGTSHALMVTYKTLTPLRITPSERASEIHVFLNCRGKISFRGFKDGQVVTSMDVDINGEKEVNISADALEYIEILPISAVRMLHLMRVCFMPLSDKKESDDYIIFKNNLISQTAQWCQEDHVLDPDSEYKLKVATRVRQWKDGDELQEQPPVESIAYFRTTGPPGFFTTSGLLADLGPYVNMEASSPTINGVLPVYRGYDIRIVFNENYIRRMYSKAGSELSIVVVDQNGVEASDAQGKIIKVNSEWNPESFDHFKQSDKLWMKVLSASECEPSIDLSCIKKPNSLEGRLPEKALPAASVLEARVKASGKDESLYRIIYTSSHFVSFTHHIQSFINNAWNYARLREAASLSGSLLDTQEFEKVTDIIASLQSHPVHQPANYDPESEVSKFEELAILFKLVGKPLPNKTEITALNDEPRYYALLLESPEPIQWDRVTFEVKAKLTVEATPEPIPSKIKITGARLDAMSSGGTNYNEEWIELLVVEPYDLLGTILEHRRLSDTEFTRYFEFGSEASLQAGTVIKIHSGVSESNNENSIFQKRYRTGDYDSVNWQFDPEGEVIQIRSRTGQILHKRTFFAANDYGVMSAIIVRNRDQTKAFIFISKDAATDHTDLPSGRYQFNFSFKGNMGEHKPVLRLQGFEIDESTTIEFSLPAAEF
jgi:hypothetical protein